MPNTNTIRNFAKIRNSANQQYFKNMSNRITLKDKTFEPYLPHDKIMEGIEAVAARINADYSATPIPVFLGVLNGCFMFMAELMQRITFDCETSFVKLASYQGTCSTGEVTELIGLKENLCGRHVIVVEDIVDTGRSIEHLMEMLKHHAPASIEIATLLFKPESYTKDIEIKYSAISIPDHFIVGFGLDYDGLGRNLRDIYMVKDGF